MFKAARNDYRVNLSGKSRGIALLVMLSLILVVFTVMAITRLSANSNDLKQKETTLKVLTQTRDAIMGYALTQRLNARPPGTLPCPDTDHDGHENTSAGVCTSVNRRGLVPYIDLEIPEPFDGTGAPLWYAVANNYAGNISTGSRNSSLTSTLLLNGQAMAFIVIAPQDPIDNQQRTYSPLAAITEFLEGDNSDSTPDSYTNLQDPTHNDQLLGMPVDDFWSSVEKVVLDNIKIQITNYFTACHVYPWASDFATAGNNSVLSRYEGGAPLGTALPADWGTSTNCPPPIPTSTPLRTVWWPHWQNMFYYAICKQSTAVNPPIASCLSLMNAAGVTTGNARVILISPGKRLTGQNRPPTAPLAITNFFEGRDATPNDNQFDNITPTATDNDITLIIAP